MMNIRFESPGQAMGFISKKDQGIRIEPGLVDILPVQVSTEDFLLFQLFSCQQGLQFLVMHLHPGDGPHG